MTVASKRVNLEGFRRLLGELEGADMGPYAEQLGAVIGQMGRMNGLLGDLAAARDESELEAAQGRLRSCQEDCQAAMGHVLSSLGITQEETEAHFSDPKNFNQQEWEAIQGIRQKVAETEENVAPSPIRLKKQERKK